MVVLIRSGIALKSVRPFWRIIKNEDVDLRLKPFVLVSCFNVFLKAETFFIDEYSQCKLLEHECFGFFKLCLLLEINDFFWWNVRFFCIVFFSCQHEKPICCAEVFSFFYRVGWCRWWILGRWQHTFEFVVCLFTYYS